MIKEPEGTEEIGVGAFFGCRSLVEVELPSTLQHIGERAFEDCISLTRVTLPLSPVIHNHFRSNESLAPLTFLPSPNELQAEPLEGNTLLHLCVLNKHPHIPIAHILKKCPNAIQQRNTLGQTPLHLCITNNVSAEVTKVIYDAWLDAVTAKNELSKTPLDYWQERGEGEVIGDIIGGKASKTTTVTAFVLKGNKKAAMMDERAPFHYGAIIYCWRSSKSIMKVIFTAF